VVDMGAALNGVLVMIGRELGCGRRWPAPAS
jgi:hypothetical protein